MRSLDTNVAVRFLVNDHKEQARRARNLIERHTVWLTKTVLLETEWVLRFSYGFSTAQVNRALTGLVGLPNVEVENSALVALALGWHAHGMDFADALHLAGSAAASKFATFDEKLAKRSTRLASTPEVEVL